MNTAYALQIQPFEQAMAFVRNTGELTKQKEQKSRVALFNSWRPRLFCRDEGWHSSLTRCLEPRFVTGE